MWNHFSNFRIHPLAWSPENLGKSTFGTQEFPVFPVFPNPSEVNEVFARVCWQLSGGHWVAFWASETYLFRVGRSPSLGGAGGEEVPGTFHFPVSHYPRLVCKVTNISITWSSFLSISWVRIWWDCSCDFDTSSVKERRHCSYHCSIPRTCSSMVFCLVPFAMTAASRRCLFLRAKIEVIDKTYRV